MRDAAVALILYLSYLAVAFGLRTWLLYRQTGITGYNGPSGSVGSSGWSSGVLFIVALLLGLVAPLLQLLGAIEPIEVLHNAAVRYIAFALTLSGATATLVAQHAMGQHWRVGVNDDEFTGLVRSGLFAIVRNPFFSALLATAAGLALLTPNLLAVAAFAALFVAIELQVRAVEEPHLQTMHGDVYQDYAQKVGRFIPGVGRLRSNSSR
ncbi:isoprenylcysteine carboxyl methyltransferase [Aeromicrobium sp. PE09-221]|nr:isoprenylcysteine carboxyl methyltransferase [Aeromicrobium sp. PE09-221]